MIRDVGHGDRRSLLLRAGARDPVKYIDLPDAARVSHIRLDAHWLAGRGIGRSKLHLRNDRRKTGGEARVLLPGSSSRLDSIFGGGRSRPVLREAAFGAGADALQGR